MERWDLERVFSLLTRLHSTDPKHHDIPILQHVLDHAQPDGSLSVDFKFGKDATFGRVFSGGVGYQSCTRDTRLFCSARFYVEDDIVNAFPTIMSQVFQSAGLYCPYLVDYVARREELFQELCTPRLNRDQLKNFFFVVCTVVASDTSTTATCLFWVVLRANLNRVQKSSCKPLDTVIFELF
jgi:hypothetical protein